MNKTAFLAVMSLCLLIMAISAQGQQNSGQIYSSSVPSGAPVPVAPNSPLELGLQLPSESTSYSQAPPATETGRVLIPTDAAYAASSANAEFQKAQYSVDNNPAQFMMMLPQGVDVTNKLYVSYAPYTVAGGGLYNWLPMWLLTSESGPIWFYEWYPNGQLSVNYLGYSSGGWQKKWFFGETSGWHILQYYSLGWSNYIYIYVYGTSPGRWIDQGPYAGPASTTTPSYAGTSSVTLRSSWLMGYDVLLDGKYVGTEGKESDILDGVYRFRVPGNMWHTIVISKNGQNYDETGTFLSDAAYRFTL